MIGWIIGIIAVVIVIFLISVISWVVKTFNFFVYNRTKVDEKWSQIEVVLRKKYDMIPAIASSVKGYTSHESETLKEVTGLRSQWGKAKTSEQKFDISNALEGALGKLMVVVEKYPKLQADKGFRDLQRQISRVEGEIGHYRKDYNRRVSKYNRRIEYFPNNIVAKAFGFKKREFFSKEE